ncbi:MAG: type I methionyl aminopeptidase [Patescibacteria group bacterium]
MIILKTPEEIKIMNEANKILHQILNFIESSVQSGQSTQDLDNVAVKYASNFNVTPAFLGYGGFPKALCVSVNEEIVHGIPSKNKIISDGDVVSIDFGIEYKGFYADAARTIVVGQASEEKIRLVENTKKALMEGISHMRVGERLQDISRAIEAVAIANKYGNIRKMCGHGIGKQLHEDPHVLNYVDKKADNMRLQEGLVLAIEPMFTLGTSDIKILKDGWTAVTADNSIACHWEFSIAVLDGKPFILGVD